MPKPRLAWVAALAAAALAAFVAAAATQATRKPAPRHHGAVTANRGQNAVSAYAYVIPGEVSLNVAPVLVAARTRMFVGVTSPAPGLFCLRPARSIDASSRSWTVSPEVSRSSSPSRLMFAYADAQADGCPAGTVGVRTYELKGTTPAAVPSEHVAFMLVSG